MMVVVKLHGVVSVMDLVTLHQVDSVMGLIILHDVGVKNVVPLKVDYVMDVVKQSGGLSGGCGNALSDKLWWMW